MNHESTNLRLISPHHSNNRLPRTQRGSEVIHERSQDMDPSSNGVLKVFFIAAVKMLGEKLLGSGTKLQTILRLVKSVPFIFK